jgi:hypothetical protein
MVMVLALGIPLFLAIELFASRRHHPALNRWALNGLGTAGLLLFYFCNRHDERIIFYARYFQISLALHLLVSVAAFIFRDDEIRDENGFWQFNKEVFLRILGSVLYAGVLFAGLTASLVTFDYLFDTKFTDEIPKLWFFCAGIFQTWYFLAGIPEDPAQLESVKTYPKGLKIFTQYLLIPLLTLYMIILYLYMGKMIASWNLPKGSVGWLVSVMSVLGMFNLLLLEPIRDREENRWVRTYAKSFHILIFPLLGMLFVGLSKRLSEYGLTENRYFLVVLASWLMAISVYLLVGRDRKIKIIPLSLALLALVTSFGPWGAYNVSMNNQLHRLRRLLEPQQLLIGGKLQTSTGKVPVEVEKKISHQLDYLIEYHGIESVQPWLDEKTTSIVSEYKKDALHDRPARDARPLMKKLGLTYYSRWGGSNDLFYRNEVEKNPLLDVRGFETLFELHLQSNSKSAATVESGIGNQANSDKYTVTLLADKELIEVRSGDKFVVNISLTPLIEFNKKRAAEAKQYKAYQGLPLQQMTLSNETKDAAVRLYVHEFNGTVGGPNEGVNNIEGQLLIHVKK